MPLTSRLAKGESTALHVAVGCVNSGSCCLGNGLSCQLTLNIRPPTFLLWRSGGHRVWPKKYCTRIVTSHGHYASAQAVNSAGLEECPPHYRAPFGGKGFTGHPGCRVWLVSCMLTCRNESAELLAIVPRALVYLGALITCSSACHSGCVTRRSAHDVLVLQDELAPCTVLGTSASSCYAPGSWCPALHTGPQGICKNLDPSSAPSLSGAVSRVTD